MITKEQLTKWAMQYQEGDNYEYVQRTPYTFTDNSAHLKHKLVEAKMLVDRWDLISTDIVVHSSHKGLFRSELGDAIMGLRSLTSIRDVFASYGRETQADLQCVLDLFTEDKIQEWNGRLEVNAVDHLWGADIHYSDDVLPEQGMMIARNRDGSLMDEEHPGRCIAVFPM